MMKRAAVVMALFVFPTACKRHVDMTIPDSGTTITSASSTTNSASDLPVASTPPVTDDAPLAPLTPPKNVPVVTGGAIAKPKTDGGAVAAPTNSFVVPPGQQPAECAAAKVMRANGRQKEYDTLRAACISKGGQL